MVLTGTLPKADTPGDGDGAEVNSRLCPILGAGLSAATRPRLVRSWSRAAGRFACAMLCRSVGSQGFCWLGT